MIAVERYPGGGDVVQAYLHHALSHSSHVDGYRFEDPHQVRTCTANLHPHGRGEMIFIRTPTFTRIQGFLDVS